MLAEHCNKKQQQHQCIIFLYALPIFTKWK